MGIAFSEGPARPFGRVIYRDKISSRLALKNEVIMRILDVASHEGLVTEEEKARWRLCLDEALVNAMVHGNNGDPRRFVRVTVMSANSRWGVLIEDEGEGFDPKELPNTGSLKSLYAESGRGIVLMRSFTDELRYYRRGAALMLIKSRSCGAGVSSPAAQPKSPTRQSRYGDGAKKAKRGGADGT